MKLLLILIVSSCVVLICIMLLNKRKRNREKESQLGIFHHPSNFKKAPLEWVQRPKEQTEKDRETTWNLENQKK